MKGWNGFGRTLAFAALAGIAGLVADALFGPVLGVRTTARLAIVVSAVVYVAGLGPTRRRGAAAGAVATALGAGLLAVPFGIPCTATGAAAIVAFARSGLLYRARPMRAVIAEAGLQSAGLGLAAFLASGGPLGFALALWGYYLVQSVFFVIGGVAPRSDARATDPFEHARAELLAMLR